MSGYSSHIHVEALPILSPTAIKTSIFEKEKALEIRKKHHVFHSDHQTSSGKILLTREIRLSASLVLLS